MLPRVFPRAVVGEIPYLVTGQRLPVVGGEQVLPRAVAVGAGNRIQRRAEVAGGVGVLRFGEDIAAVIVGIGFILSIYLMEDLL